MVEKMLYDMVECMRRVVEIMYLLNLFFVHVYEIVLGEPVSLVPDI